MSRTVKITGRAIDATIARGDVMVVRAAHQVAGLRLQMGGILAAREDGTYAWARATEKNGAPTMEAVHAEYLATGGRTLGKSRLSQLCSAYANILAAVGPDAPMPDLGATVTKYQDQVDALRATPGFGEKSDTDGAEKSARTTSDYLILAEKIADGSPLTAEALAALTTLVAVYLK